ncbi:hypothetical protein ABZ863_22785 [Saccharomonospora sp. NPDC046836]|uniref:hypothetical protein n=1 Tax=Saccharomonospora sp. NPDC046836 TaxID=3156921 RepID=UPI0033FF6271
MKLIDIFTDRYEPIGTEDKQTAHAKGLWHRTFSALAIHPATKRVILQKKTPGRYSFDRPDYADITVGAHYQAGEAVPDGIREVHEEHTRSALPSTVPRCPSLLRRRTHTPVLVTPVHRCMS